MRKFLLTILAAGSIAAANAQAGSILVYGNVGITSFTNDAKANMLNWNVSPGVGYQFDNHWTAGLAFNYSLDSSIKFNGANDRTKFNHWDLGVFGRYTKNLNNIFSVYGQLDLGYESGHAVVGSTEITGSKYNGFYAMVTPAVSVNTGWCALNFSFGGLGFQSYKFSGAANSNTAFTFNFGQTANIGISKNFGCGHHMHGHHEPGDDTRHMDTNDDDDDAPKAHHDKKAKKSKKSSDNDDE